MLSHKSVAELLSSEPEGYLVYCGKEDLRPTEIAMVDIKFRGVAAIFEKWDRSKPFTVVENPESILIDCYRNGFFDKDKFIEAITKIDQLRSKKVESLDLFMIGVLGARTVKGGQFIQDMARWTKNSGIHWTIYSG